MTKYKCDLVDLKDRGQHFVAVVIMLEDHVAAGLRKGERAITSKIKMIDFERKFLVTQNSIYTWEH